MKKVLFLCSGNSARSQLAEALTNSLRRDRWQAYSAGVQPSAGVHPMAVSALDELGIPAAGLRPKHVEEFKDADLDLIVTVCDNAAEECPLWVSDGNVVHVPFADPSKENKGVRQDAFRKTRDLMRKDLVDRLSELLQSG